MPLFSVLDLSPIIEGGDAALAFRNSADLARHAEGWGYHRYWLAEHHNMPGIASAATSVVIGHVAAATTRIRVGAGGVMLPNHAPLVIAEQFGTLASLYPGRIDLALGRAPGTDQMTMRALRRSLSGGDTFPQDVIELQTYFSDVDGRVNAVPGRGLNVPIYLLGSSDFSAQLAAELGLPFAFASHFAPDYLQVAIQLYRRGFHPSAAQAKSHLMVGIGLYLAETEEAARRLFTSAQLMGLSLIRGEPGPLPPPVDKISDRWSSAEERAMAQRARYAVVGAPETARNRLAEILEETGADELIAVSQIYDHAARLRSYELGAEVFRTLA
ncbi:MAG: LLM class flavin-dependent oxidoreductase [Verrucomicrobiota bacterium]|nr:LLM class flavin-dependent oxidoreductase [Verrucomicrobiota bacterium]